MAKMSPRVCRFVWKLRMTKVQLLANETTSDAAALLTSYRDHKSGVVISPPSWTQRSLPLITPPCSITPRRRAEGDDEGRGGRELACAF